MPVINSLKEILGDLFDIPKLINELPVVYSSAAYAELSIGNMVEYNKSVISAFIAYKHSISVERSFSE